MSTNLQTVEPQAITPEIVESVTAFPLSADRKELFFRSLIATGGHVGKACDLAKISRQRVLQWRSEDAAFARDYEEALEYGTENLEERLYSRALDTDTTAAIFLLKARRPNVYRENIRVETELTENAVERFVTGFMDRLLEMREQKSLPTSDSVTPDENTR
jgi:hypothetical protein